MSLLVHMRKVVLIMPVFARPEYLLRCTDSLDNLVMAPSEIVFIDDASSDLEITHILDHYGRHNDARVERHTINKGVREAVKTGCKIAFDELYADLVVVLDSDAIVKPDFLDRIVYLHNKYGNICSGFNAYNKINPIESVDKNVVFKKHVNGINVCFNKEQYDKYVAPSLEVVGNWDYNTSLKYQADNKLFSITAPSVVQHIGLVSSMGHTDNGVKPDFAYDY